MPFTKSLLSTALAFTTLFTVSAAQCSDLNSYLNCYLQATTLEGYTSCYYTYCDSTTQPSSQAAKIFSARPNFSFMSQTFELENKNEVINTPLLSLAAKEKRPKEEFELPYLSLQFLGTSEKRVQEFVDPTHYTALATSQDPTAQLTQINDANTAYMVCIFSCTTSDCINTCTETYMSAVNQATSTIQFSSQMSLMTDAEFQVCSENCKNDLTCIGTCISQYFNEMFANFALFNIEKYSTLTYDANYTVNLEPYNEYISCIALCTTIDCQEACYYNYLEQIQSEATNSLFSSELALYNNEMEYLTQMLQCLSTATTMELLQSCADLYGLDLSGVSIQQPTSFVSLENNHIEKYDAAALLDELNQDSDIISSLKRQQALIAGLQIQDKQDIMVFIEKEAEARLQLAQQKEFKKMNILRNLALIEFDSDSDSTTTNSFQSFMTIEDAKLEATTTKLIEESYQGEVDNSGCDFVCAVEGLSLENLPYSAKDGYLQENCACTVNLFYNVTCDFGCSMNCLFLQDVDKMMTCFYQCGCGDQSQTTPTTMRLLATDSQVKTTSTTVFTRNFSILIIAALATAVATGLYIMKSKKSISKKTRKDILTEEDSFVLEQQYEKVF